jgi:predicted P-loop ATPase
MTTALMSIFDSITSQTTSSKDLKRIIEEIRSPKHSSTIQKIRELRSLGNNDVADKLKKSLPAFTPSGVFDKKRGPTNLITYSGILHVDIDKITDEQRIELTKRLIHERDVLCFFTSPSGVGLKICYQCNGNKENHEKNIQKLFLQFEKKYGIKPDPSCKDISRLCFFSHDPDAYYNSEAEHIELLDYTKFEDIVVKIEKEQKLSYSKHSRNDFIFRFALQCKAKKYDRSDVLDYCIPRYVDVDFSAQEITNAINSAYKPEYSQNTTQLVFESKFDQIAQAISTLGYRFKRNVVKNSIECSFQNGPWFDLTETTINDLIRQLHSLRIKCNDSDLRMVLNSSQYESFDPFSEYISNLNPWDGHDYIGDLFATLNCGTENDIYLKKWLILLASSMAADSITNQYVLTLIGPQGVGKTRWLNKLMPIGLKQYMYQGILDLKDKDTKIALAENLIINIDELDALNKAETARLKELITSEGYKVRPPYGKIQEYRRRRASFCASVNNPQFLMDKTGSRRYLCLELKNTIDHMHNIDMDKVYSQALSMFHLGEELFFNNSETAEIQTKNESFKSYSMEDELLTEYVRKPEYGEYAKSMSATEIARHISTMDDNFIPSTRSNNEIGVILTNKGFERTKSNGINKYKVILIKNSSNSYF